MSWLKLSYHITGVLFFGYIHLGVDALPVPNLEFIFGYLTFVIIYYVHKHKFACLYNSFHDQP